MTEGFVPVPNAYFEHLADLSGAELKVLLAILRRTVGWRKESDEISIEQLQQMTGLARNSVRAGLRGLLERGLIEQRSNATGSKAASYTCIIPSHSGSKIDPLGGQKLTPKEEKGVKNCPPRGSKIDPTTYIYRQQTRECARIARTLALARKRERKDPRLPRSRA